MGTNFYWTPKPEPRCPHCGHQPTGDRIHIGKSSAGWTFSLHVYPDREPPIRDLPDWEALWKSGQIEDEYGSVYSPEEMRRRIAERGWTPPTDIMDARWYRENYATPGPNGLARSKIDGYRIIGHGAGTWDLQVGEFS